MTPRRRASPVTGAGGSFAATFTTSGAGIGYTSPAGCAFDFKVSGDTATLSNAPVICSSTDTSGAAVQTTVQDYTVTTSDGHHLTATLDGTFMSGGTNCTFTETVTALR